MARGGTGRPIGPTPSRTCHLSRKCLPGRTLLQARRTRARNRCPIERAWTVDPELKDQRKDDDRIQQTRFRNCLANQVVHAVTSKENGRPVDRISEKLARIADGNLIGTMVVWKRLARSRPESIYTLPPEVKAKIRAYLAEALELR